MTVPVYIYHMGRLIEKSARPREIKAASDLPAPNVQGFQSYESPIDGSGTISSHRQRERDLNNSGSYDPRDTPAEFRKAKDGRRKLKRAAALS